MGKLIVHNENIDEKYKESAHKLTEFLASEGNTLVWGSGCRSIMGICYEEFAKGELTHQRLSEFKHKIMVIANDMINKETCPIEAIFVSSISESVSK